MTSRFTIKSVFPLACIPFILFGLIGYILFAFDKTRTPQPLRGIPLIILLIFTLLWLFFGEFRTKMIKVELDNTFLTIKKFGGLSPARKYFYKDLDGYQTSILRSSSADNEYLYFIQNNKKIGKISDFYHKNYLDLKREIEIKLKDLGFERFKYIDEFKEIFT